MSEQTGEPNFVDRRASMRPENSNDSAPQETETNNVDQTPDALASQLADEKEKAQSYLANWQRAAADYQNYKRRVDQEREDLARFANVAMVINLLPLLDDLERALQSVDARLAGLTWVDGIGLIYRKFKALLEANGVEEIVADGADFDPSIHEAVTQADGEEGKVISVVQKGYKLGGRVIRPAMVVVGKER
jgi:molecular chaperone GrpE